MDYESRNSPSILITTSRNPSHFLRRAANILKYCFSSASILNRGSLNENHLLNYSIYNNIYLLLILKQIQQRDVIEVISLFLSDKSTQTSFTILISELIDLKRHDSQTRIQPAPIKLEFSENINENTIKLTSSLLKPILINENYGNPNIYNLIQFQSEEKGVIKGKFTQNKESISKEILRFTMKCD